MTSARQDTSPLQISFSNAKDFEPSTPSQTSPPSTRKQKQASIHIRNPLELFSTERTNRASSIAKPSTPLPKKVNRYDTKYPSANRKTNSMNKKSPPVMLLENDSLKQRKRVDVRLWGNLQSQYHLKQIARLDSLISRVETHMNFYGRLYPKKYF